MPAVPFQTTGTAPEDEAWSWDAETSNAVLGDDPEKPDWTRYREAHAWWAGSGDAAETKAGYSLPHHKMGESGLEAVWRGVTAAMARLSQADIPDGEMQATFDHLAQHYQQWQKEPPKWERFRADVEARRRRSRQAQISRALALPMVATRASVVTVQRSGGTPTDADMARINAMARSPLSPDDVYVVPAEISNESIDAYFTQMTPETLSAFAQDATTGVAFCDSHVHGRLPMGRSFYGDTATVTHDGAQMLSAQALAYMLRNLPMANGLNSNDVIRGMDGGIYNDVSVGFIPEHFWCSICGLDMLSDWECNHWPGTTYETKAGDKLCIAQVDARLAEFSLVYDGATPNAMLLKAEAELERGRATARQIALVEDRCRTKLMDRFRGYGAGMIRPTSPVGPVAGSPATEGRTDAGTDPTATHDEGEDEMRGTEFIRGIMERSGAEISKGNMDRLAEIHDKLSAGHDTVQEAMRLMGDFLAEKRDQPDGDNDQPDSKEGDDDGDAEKAGENEGDDDHGESKDDAKKPDQPKPAKNDKDGDGDDDNPNDEDADDAEDDRDAPPAETAEDADDAEDDEDADDAEDDESEDGDEGKKPTAKSSKSGKRSPDPVPQVSARDHALMEIGRRVFAETIDEALAAGVRAMGEGFDAGRYRSVMEGLMERGDYEAVRQMRDDWSEIAKRVLSPRGIPSFDRSAAGGVRWSAEPTATGARQTVARDPNDPTGAVAGGARPRGGLAYPAQPASGGVTGDPSLYRVGNRSKPRR